jgi:spermidine synthase
LNFLFKGFSGNQEIMVYDAPELFGEKGKFRVLKFSNNAIQGAMDLDHPERILFEYPRAVIHLMEFNHPSFEDVFAIGHGIGTIAGYFSEKRFKVAELDMQIVELSRKYFGYRKDNVTVGDGRQILGSERPHSFDYLIVDAFTEQGTPRHLVSTEFFRIAQSKLDSRGCLILNLIRRGANDRQINDIHTTLGGHFPYTKTFSLPSERASDVQNIIIMGSNRPIGFRARHMAGFTEIELGKGRILLDSDRQ